MKNNETNLSLLTIIVNRGKGSNVLSFASERGAEDASCLLGQGTVNNKVLQMIEMNDIEKEIILIVVATEREADILDQLNKKFNFERKNYGIAFTIPLTGMMDLKRDAVVKWCNADELSQNAGPDYTMLLIIVDKGRAANVIQISQDAGYYGGTIIKARGASGKPNVVLDMIVKQEKEAVLILTKKTKADTLAALLSERINLDQPNMGSLYKIKVGKTVGLFQEDMNE